MILHLILNSLIVFIAFALIIEFSLFITRIKNSRIRYICRSLPFLKIPFDLFIFIFYGDSLFINLNPFSCEIYVYELIYKLLPQNTMSISNVHNYFVIPQYIAMQIPNVYLKSLTLLVLVLAIGGIFYKLFKLFSSRKYFQAILTSATSYSTLISNHKLSKDLLRLNAIILVSSDISVPFANNRYILLPQNMLDTLSISEIEAVIAHELQHIKWKDPFFKFFYSLVCSLCWWIPTSWWLRRLIDDQEQACDAGIYNYGIDNHDLATAVTKILYRANNIRFEKTALSFFASSQKTHLNRLKHILNSHAISSNNRYVLNDILATIQCLFTFISFWMC